jgi:hypothetical protein
MPQLVPEAKPDSVNDAVYRAAEFTVMLWDAEVKPYLEAPKVTPPTVPHL